MSSDSPKPPLGTAEWASSQSEERGRLMAELVTELRAAQDASHQLDDLAARAMGVNRTDARCVDLIDLAGRLTAGELARRAGLTSGAVTAVLDRLERSGYVRRIHDRADRRRVQVEITDRAREEAMRVYGPLKDRAAAFLGELGEDDLRLLVEFHRVSRRVNEERAAEIRAELGGRR